MALPSLAHAGQINAEGLSKPDLNSLEFCINVYRYSDNSENCYCTYQWNTYLPVILVLFETTNPLLSLGVLTLDCGSVLSLEHRLAVLVELQLGDDHVRWVETDWN